MSLLRSVRALGSAAVLVQQHTWYTRCSNLTGPAAWTQHLPRSLRPFSSSSDGGGSHPHFPRLSDNPSQPRFEAAEVTMALDSLFTSPWFQLADTPLGALFGAVRRPLQALGAALMRPVHTRMTEIATAMVSNEVEGAFEREEFLEGANVAAHTIMDLLSARDWEALKEVCSERMVERLKISLYELEVMHGLQLRSITMTECEPQLRVVNLWTAANIAKLDPGWAEAVSPTTSSSWLVASVHMRAKLDAAYNAAGKPGAVEWEDQRVPPPDGTSPPDHHQHLHRTGLWLFARGPLPAGFSSQLHLPWKVLAVS